MSDPLRIVVTGLIGQHPLLGGVAWDYVQYPAGLARMGHDVFYIEDSGEWPYVADGGADGKSWVAPTPDANLKHLSDVMERFGLAERWAYRFPTRDTWHGLSDARRNDVLATADLLLNVSGTLEHPERYGTIPRRAYLDSDPPFTQIRMHLDACFRERVKAHNVRFSFGERLPERFRPDDECWRPTRQPVLLNAWASTEAPRPVFTTVMSWTSYTPLEFEGTTYGQKDIEFGRFLDLPKRVAPAPMEVAVGRTHHVNWERLGRATAEANNGEPTTPVSPPELLRRHGWHVVDPYEVCAGVDGYRRYIVESGAEWSVAKNGYVEASPGWFSCRSACYLAAGRPVAVQETGFSDILPTGEGLLSFRTVEEAEAAVGEIRGHYDRHARAARALAAEWFDSDRVLARLIEEAMHA